MALENEYMLEELTAEEIYQKKLTAGANITINNQNVISATGGGSSVQYTSNYAQGDILGTLNIDGASSAIRTPNLVEGEKISITRDQQTGALTISSNAGSGDLSAHELTEEAYNNLTPGEKTNGELYLTHPATVDSNEPNKIFYNDTLYGIEVGNDILYGEKKPDNEDDGVDKDFYLKVRSNSDILAEEDVVLNSTTAHPMALLDFINNKGIYSFTVQGNPSGNGAGEEADFPFHNLIEGEKYQATFTVSFDSNTLFKEVSPNTAYFCGKHITLEDTTEATTYTTEFTCPPNPFLRLQFYRLRDGVTFNCHITNLTIKSYRIEEIYNKHDKYWRKYIPPQMVGAAETTDGQSGTVPAPTRGSVNYLLKGDGTWGLDTLENLGDVAFPELLEDGQILKYNAKMKCWENVSPGSGGGEAISDLTDVNLTNLADGEILKYDATVQKWINSVGDGGTDEHAVHVPPVIFDNGGLKKMSVDNFPGLEKVYLTSEEYTQLTTDQKQDLSKIYYVSTYVFYTFKDGEIIIRVNGTTYEWFFNGFILTEDYYTIPSEYEKYTNTRSQCSTAWSDNTSSTSLGIIEIGRIMPERISVRDGSDNYIKNTPVYGKIIIGNGSSQTETYSDPYDTENPIVIYYGNKQYTNFDIPSPSINSVQVPPVIFDNGNLKKVNDVDGFPGLEKVFLTPTSYEALTQTEKEDLSKIYYVSEYDYYSDKGGTLVLRVKNDEIKLFVNGFVDENTYLEDGNFTGIIDDKIRELKGSYFIGSIAYNENKEPIGGSVPYVYIDANYSRIAFRNAGGDSSSVIHTTAYAVIDLTNYSKGSVLQSNPWEDPYDISGNMTIYYGGKQYSEYEIPNPLPEVTSTDNDKVLKVINGAWAAAAGAGGSEAVYLPLADYEELTTAEKEDPTKIYFVKDTGTTVSETKTQDDGTVTASSVDGTHYAWYVFDAQGNNRYWSPNDTTFSGSWFKYEFANMYTFTGIDIWLSTWDPRLVRVVIEASNNNSTWTNITQNGYYDIKTVRSGWNATGTKYSFILNANTIFKYFRITFSLSPASQTTQSETALYVQHCNIKAATDARPKIYYKNVLYTPDELPATTISDAGKVLKVNEDGLWDKGDIREVPAITLSDEEKILTVESGTAAWASPKKITHLYDVIPLENPLYRIGSITPSTSPVTIDMTQITPNYSELLSTDFEFVFMQGESDSCMRAWYGNPIDNTPGTFSYTPSTGELIATLRGGFTGGQFGIVYKKSVIQISQPALVSGSTATIDCSDIPNAETLTVADFALVITNVYEPSTSNNGNISLGYSFSYDQTTKTFSGYVGAGTSNQLTVSGYFIVANYGDPEYRLITNFTGATSSSDGYRGYVPAPLAGDENKVLKGDGTWGENANRLILDAQIYSLEEKQVGVWVDRKPLYQKTFEMQSEITVTNTWDWTSLGISAGDIETYVSAVAQNNSGTCWAVNCATINDNIAMSTGRNQDTIGVKKFTILYTKTTDSAGSGGYQAYGFSPIIYSEEEREVGVGKNNKPLYQKTFKSGLISADAISADILTNIDECYVVDIKIYNSDNTIAFIPLSISMYNYQGIGTNYGYVYYDVTNHSVKLVNQSRKNSVYIEATIQYTKTTDVVGSGSYNTLGVPMTHIDGSEQVIGTLFGETLYQKSYQTTVTVTKTARAWYTLLTSSQLRAINANKVLIDDTHSFIELNDSIVNLNYSSIVNGAGGTAGCSYTSVEDEVQVCLYGFAAGTYPATVTVQYTKTTD